MMRQILLIPAEEGHGFTVEVPSLPGCISQGDTLEEAIANIREAIALYLESLTERGKPIPEDSELQVLRV